MKYFVESPCRKGRVQGLHHVTVTSGSIQTTYIHNTYGRHNVRWHPKHMTRTCMYSPSSGAARCEGENFIHTHTHVGHRWTEKGLIACRQCRSSTHVHGRVESCTLLQGHTCSLVPTQTSSSRSWLCTTSGTWVCATPQSRRCTCVSTVCT